MKIACIAGRTVDAYVAQESTLMAQGGFPLDRHSVVGNEPTVFNGNRSLMRLLKVALEPARKVPSHVARTRDLGVRAAGGEESIPATSVSTGWKLASLAALFFFSLTSQLATAGGAERELVVDHGLVIKDVTVVGTRDGHLSPGMSVVVEDGKIVHIAPSRSVRIRGDAHTVEARGKYVVPGYLDMHAHPLNLPDPRGYLALMLASGVTGYRQMSGSPELLQARHDGKLDYPLGPELLALPGTILTDSFTPTPQAAAAEVRKQKDEGADFIKEVGVSSANFFGALNEAKALGIPFAGHLQPDVDVRVAAAGMRSIEHLDPKEAVLLGCSNDEGSIRQFLAQTPTRPPQVGPGSAAMADLVAQAIANPIMATPPQQLASMRRVLDSYDEAKCRNLAATFVANKTWQVPTLIRLRTMSIPGDQAYVDDPNLRFVDPVTRRMWAQMAQQFPNRLSAADRDMVERFFALQLKTVKLFEDAGVSMMAGSDTGGAQWVVPGFSLHQDLDLFAQAGLTPLEVLQIATLNPAKFLGRERTMGAVEVGKNANLVLLDANPLTDVAHMHQIFGVTRAGVYYSQPALSKLRASALP